MRQEGAIILGVGGDNSHATAGSFFEGVMTAGFPSDSADSAVQSNIVAVGYGAPTGLSGALTPGSEISLRATRRAAPESMSVTRTAPLSSRRSQ
jgi:non-reducing end alpha-L-arabinofuranosidase